MQARISLLLTALLAVILAGAAIPLGYAICSIQTRDVHQDRLADAQRVAGLVSTKVGAPQETGSGTRPRRCTTSTAPGPWW